MILLLFCLMGLLHMSIWKDEHQHLPYLAHLPLKADTMMVSLKEIQRGHRLKAVAELRSLKRDSAVTALRGKLLLYFPYDHDADLSLGQTLFISDANIERLPEARNPGQFDYGDYLRRRGIIAQCRIKDTKNIHVSKAAIPFSLENNFFFPLRRHFTREIESYFSPENAAFLQALLLGIRTGLDAQTLEDFQNAGVIHVLAISGLHVGFVALIFHIVLSFLPLFFKQRNMIIIILLIGYALLTGGHPPVVRATIMAVFFFTAINLERRGSVYNYLFAAGFIILLTDPQQLFWIGFLFSFSAVLSIVYFYPKLKIPANKLLHHIDNDRWRRRAEHWLVTPFLVTLAAQIGTLPLVMHFFHKLSLISFLLNLLAIPYTALLVAMGFLFLCLSIFSATLSAAYADTFSILIEIFTAAIHAAGNLPLSYINISTFGILNILIYSAVILLLFHLKDEGKRVFFALVTAVCILISTAIQLLEDPSFNLIILDVGQGDAAMITTPAEKTILIDSGPADRYYNAADQAIIPAMQHLDIKHINFFFISHPHLDHMGGTFRLLRYATIDSVFLPKTPLPYFWNDTLLQVLDEKNIPVRFLAAGDRVAIDAETAAFMLSPFPILSRYHKPDGHSVNNNSLVMMLKHRDQNLLFTGDAEETAEQYLKNWGDLLKSDFLKTGHHGSRTSTTEDFLELVNPTYASISAGRRNKFGHPSNNVLGRFSSYGVTVLRTDLQKAIWLRWQKNRWSRIGW